jgi:periplasmic divalent cation tolerance protein
MSDAVLVLTTVPSTEVGETIGYALVDAALAACVNVLPPMVSIYRWKGEVQREQECQLVIKTVRARVDAVQAAVSDLHPYDLPELLVVPADGGDPAYLAWVATETGTSDA